MKQSANYSFVNNPFLIIRITNSIIKKNGQSIHSKKKILNFDTKKIVIPNDPTKTIFKVNAAIGFQPSDKENPTMGGHYTCWVRGKIENKWFQLSERKKHLVCQIGRCINTMLINQPKSR